MTVSYFSYSWDCINDLYNVLQNLHQKIIFINGYNLKELPLLIILKIKITKLLLIFFTNPQTDKKISISRVIALKNV